MAAEILVADNQIMSDKQFMAVALTSNGRSATIEGGVISIAPPMDQDCTAETRNPPSNQSGSSYHRMKGQKSTSGRWNYGKLFVPSHRTYCGRREPF